MHMNWSIILNIVLLGIVLFAIKRLMSAERKNAQLQKSSRHARPNDVLAIFEEKSDDIISIRKLDESPVLSPEDFLNDNDSDVLFSEGFFDDAPTVKNTVEPIQTSFDILKKESSSAVQEDLPAVIMIFLHAKPGRQLAGYELLQTLLAVGLRFGEGEIFHRHQFMSGQGPVLCSLASASETGTFDLQNMGAFATKGLCLFMYTSGNPSIDGERFYIMLDTAQQLSEELGTNILDEKQNPLTEQNIDSYVRLLQIDPSLKKICYDSVKQMSMAEAG